jgi:hypothetical protein
MIAKCLDALLQPKHDDHGHTYQIWEDLRPIRSVIIANEAASKIEQLRCQDFDSNELYVEEMVSLFEQLVLEQGTDVMTMKRLHLLIILGLQSLPNNKQFASLYS